jgi:hypothetical protein
MAIDATNVYWTEGCTYVGGGYVRKVPKAGGDIVTLATGDNPSGIVTDGINVYWSTSSNTTSGAIMRVPVGGGTPTTLATSPGPSPYLALDASFVYWTETPSNQSGAVMKVPLAGGPATRITWANWPNQLALGETDVYWKGNLEGAGGGVMKAPKAGGTPVALTSPFVNGSLAGLAANESDVYFYSGDAPNHDTMGVSAVPTNGGSVRLISAAAWTVYGGPVVIDATRVYWTDGSYTVYAAPLAGGKATAVAVGQLGIVALAVDATTLYWLGGGDQNGSPPAIMTFPLANLDASGR